MKKWAFLLVCLLLVGLCVACGNAGSTTDYELPFSVEDVSSITISNIWGEYKLIEDTAGIENLVAKMNDIEEYPFSSYNEEKDGPHPGTYGYDILFVMKDGNQWMYSVVPLEKNNALLYDELEEKHKVRNFVIDDIWNELDYEVQKKDPAA